MFVVNIFRQNRHLNNHQLLCRWRLCESKWPDWLKVLSHSEHLYGLSPVWTLTWTFRVSQWLNALSQTWHLYCLSPTWTLMCLFRLPDWLNASSHMWHLNGLSPVWTLMWLLNVPDWLNALSHKRHSYGLSPLWILLCCPSAADVANRLLQTVHSNGFSPEWHRLCASSALPSRQHLRHSAHLYLLAWTLTWLHRLFRAENCFPHWLQEYSCFLLRLFPRDVNVSCEENAVEGVHKYCFADRRVLPRTLQLSSSTELPVRVEHKQTLRDMRSASISSKKIDE